MRSVSPAASIVIKKSFDEELCLSYSTFFITQAPSVNQASSSKRHPPRVQGSSSKRHPPRANLHV